MSDNNRPANPVGNSQELHKDSINMKIVIDGIMDEVILKTTHALKEQGFGVLTRIDLHSKIKEKLGKDINPVVILGACNPELAYEAYSESPDVASLLPCNAVIRELTPGRVSIELAKPTALMEILGNEKLKQLAKAADEKLIHVLELLGQKN
jgi:uncharacterized protein (DUF302 family)